ncbi:hypothetical protein PV516_18985 [Streptomyces scabiei]|uniref:hypothetical protein n=1 Tax=Streptomyces scabiei TaxID=1930 RepID=UPI0029BD4906|nr:hypothetical protein [Streptomyces scabiei]MDX3165873.1 hypothetical protein [Streptomyces scabiei]
MMVASLVQSADAGERVQNEIGPRAEGVTYFNPTGTFDVLKVLRGAEATQALGRRTAWAVEVRRTSTGEVSVHAMTWTNSDHVIEPKPVKVRRVDEIREDLAKGTVSAVDCDVLTNLAECAAYGKSEAVTTR